MSPSKHLAAWKKAVEPREISTSIADVTIRPVSLQNLIMSGHVPVADVEGLQRVQKANSKRGAGDNIPLSEAIQFAKMINTVVLLAVVDPPLSEDGEGDTFNVNDIPFEDRVAIFNEANGGFEKIRKFRKPEGEPINSSRDSE
jgi:hypothetical protein